MPSIQTVTSLLGFDPLLVAPVFVLLVLMYLFLKPKLEDKIEEVVSFSSVGISYLILYLAGGETFDFAKSVIHALVLGGISTTCLFIFGPIMRPIIKATQRFIILQYEKKTGIDVEEGDEDGSD